MPRATKAELAARRRLVAAGEVAGASTRSIARRAGVSRRQVQRDAADPATRFLVTEALRPHRKKLERLATKVITAVEKALAAKKSDKVDHYTRLRAVERFGDLLGLAQGRTQSEDGDRTGAGVVTWEEFVLLYRSRKENVHADRPIDPAPVA